MTSAELFKEMLQDPILQEKYELSKERLTKMGLHEASGPDIIEMVKLVITSIENDMPDRSVNSQVQKHFKI
jgi:hypothetical protein